MSSPKSPYTTATVVDFEDFRQKKAQVKSPVRSENSPESNQGVTVDHSAIIAGSDKGLNLCKPYMPQSAISLRPYLPYRASVEIDELPWLQAQFGVRERDRFVRDTRSILNAEFGQLRVYRYRRVFVVRHRCVEELIAGLLRAQFHAYQIALPEENVFGDAIEPNGLSLTWGVGHSTSEAEVERLKRRRQKQYRR